MIGQVGDPCTALGRAPGGKGPWWIALVLFGLLVSMHLGAIPSLAEGGASPPEIANPPPAPTPEDPFVGGVERTLFDLYLSDRFVGGALADYTEGWCEVDDPLGMLDQVDELQRERTEEIVPLLAGRIERTRTISGIGQVTCDIFTFRLVLELEPQFLKARAKGQGARIADPETGFSLQQNIGVAAAGEFNGDTNSAFSHRSVFGLGRYFGRINGAVIQDEPYELTEASAFGYLGDFELGSGFLETTGQSFANSLQYTGLQLRTTDKLLLDKEEGRGSPFEIFIPSRARVEFYRAGRLISVQSLDFGLQEVDTRSFPQGSYDVDVIITETNGRVTQDRKFFTKSGLLSIRGRPTWDLQGGVLRDEFSTEDTPVYYTGVQWRASNIFDLGASVYGSDDLAIGQTTVTGLYRDIYLVAGSSFSSEGDLGVNGTMTFQLFDTAFNGGFARSLEVSESSRAIALTPTPSPDDPPEFIVRRDRTRELFFQDRESYSGSVRRTFGRVELGYVYQREQFEDDTLRRSYGPVVQWNIFDRLEDSLRYTGSYYRTEIEDVQSNSLFYRYRLSPEWNLGAQLAFYDRDTTDELVGYLTVSYQDRGRAQYASRLSLTSEVRDRHGGDDSGTVFSNQLNADYGGAYLFGRSFIRDVEGTDSDNDSFGVMAESALLVSSRGTAAVSYPMGQDAVFIADIKGASPGTRFQVVLNDQVYDTVQAGRRSAVSVPPFRSYRISIRPEDASQLVDYDTTVHTVTFFPGNVVERSWDVSQVVIILGRVVDPAGEPIPLERIRGTREFVATDDGGAFQAEVVGDEVLTIERDGKTCTVELGDYERPEYFVELGDVVCR